MIRRKTIHLDDAGPQEVAPRNAPIGAVWVEEWPTGATMQLRVGESSDPIDINSNFAYELYGSDRNGGIYIDNDTQQPGVSVVIYVSSADRADGAA